nr:sensor domain-containing diguanylate cyclase [Symbiobacterium terraclitae]
MELLPVLKARGVQDVVQAAVRHIVRATGSRTGIVLLLDEQAQVLRPHYLHSEAPLSPEEREAIMTTTIRVGVGLSGWVAKHGQSIFTNDAVDDPRSVQVPGTPREDESILVVPLMTNGRLYGVLRVDRQGKNQYQLSDLHLLELMAAHVSDAISRAELEERLARRDALTGVYNRHYLNEWSQRVKSESREVSVLLIDCRKFKQINDRWGHLTGDWVLQQCAQIISNSVRSRDLVVRYGGDEFLVVLADTGRQEAQAIAERVLQRVEEWNRERSEDEPRLYLDIGVETAQQSEWQKLLDRADERMYACKHA